MFEIFQFEFILRAGIAGVAVAIIAPLMGIFLVVRRYSMMADTLAHVSLFGAAVGSLSGAHPLLTAAVVSVASAVGIERLRHQSGLPGDALLALFLYGGLALAIIIASATQSVSGSLMSYLFGSITTVSEFDVLLIVALCAAVLAIVIALYKEFFLVSLDEELARAQGMRTGTFNVLLIALAALSVSLSIKIIGALLVGALVVIPIVAAIQCRRGFGKTLTIAIAISVVSVLSGLLLSYYVGWPSGATTVICLITIFLMCVLIPKRSY